MRLLIVDDHAGVRAMIRQIAALPTEAVCECASGEEALLVVREFAPDFVTMDLRLPGLGGFATTRAIRTLVPSAQVIIVSTYDQPEFRHAALIVGAVGYVVKDNLGELRSLLTLPKGAVRRPTATPDSDVSERKG